MKIKELLEKLDTLEDRECLRGLAKMLSDVSVATLNEFQNNWDGRRPFEEFVAAQNKVIRDCVKLEMSSIGGMVRAQLGMAPLTEDTEF